MRILMISWEYPPQVVGGLGQHVYDLSHALVAEGHRVQVITPAAADHLPAEARENGVQVFRAGPYPVQCPDFMTWVMLANFKLTERALQLIRQSGPPEVVHVHDWLDAFTGAVLKHSFQLPLVATIHATEAGRNHGLHNDLQRYISSVEWWLNFEAWQVIVCSQAMRDEVRGLFQVPDDKISVIPNGVNAQGFRVAREDEQVRLRYARPDEQIVFFVGRLVREKGVHVLLDAVPSVLAAVPKAKFVIAGSGPAESELRHQAWNMGLGDKVFFAGRIDNYTRNQLYRFASAAVFPSLYEPFGIVALEAMAAGTPLVVSDAGGFSQIISHGINGMKSYIGDANSLATQVIALLRDRGLAEALRRRGLAEVAERYDWKRIAGDTAAVYQTVVRQARRAPWERHKPLNRRQGSKNPAPPVAAVSGLPERYTLVDRRVEAVQNYQRQR